MLSGPSKHLHVVMNDPIYHPNKGGLCVLLVCFCTHTDALQDSTCLLQPGDHPFIKRTTYVDYSRALLANSEPLERHVVAGIHQLGEPASQQLYDRIRLGFRQSRRTPPKIRNFMDFASL